MKRNLSSIALAELRGDRPDVRSRIEKLILAWPSGVTRNGYDAISVGGNSGIYIPGKHVPVIVDIAHNITAHYLRPQDNGLPSFVIYPFGIVNLTDEGRPVFEDPAKSTMRSVALEFRADEHRSHWLQQRVEPLFNVTDNGAVLARFHDQPTPTELQFVRDILDEWESAPSCR